MIDATGPLLDGGAGDGGGGGGGGAAPVGGGGTAPVGGGGKAAAVGAGKATPGTVGDGSIGVIIGRPGAAGGAGATPGGADGTTTGTFEVGGSEGDGGSAKVCTRCWGNAGVQTAGAGILGNDPVVDVEAPVFGVHIGGSVGVRGTDVDGVADTSSCSNRLMMDGGIS